MRARLAAPLFAAALAAGCGQSWTTSPAGPQAARVSTLWWLLFALGTGVYVLVLVLLVAGSRPGRRHPRTDAWFLVGGGVALPAVVLSVVLAANLATLAATPQRAEFVVEVTGHQYWWEVVYPDSGAVTANEIHVPVGVPVEIRLESADVLHSFWVPRLAGKTDLVPGARTTQVIQADAPGTYRGVCAEFCGLQHANMALVVVAEEPAAFTAWAQAQAAPAQPPEQAMAQVGQELLVGSSCAGCHAIRGTSATGRIGPDLTHVGSRSLLAAGAIPNTYDALVRWLEAPDAVKPGVLMPRPELDASEIRAVALYLEGLR